ncbi:helix-turn-helix domain-containing protein [Desulfobacter sp.]|uniref:helix-turn-helix domain-containing protein n=1 Tax=Desulfobacter sp. TaxID=2294 RepID=UPI003D0DC28B
MSSLGERLKKTIKTLQLTREEFAVLCDVSRSQLYRYLNGEQEPGMAFLKNLQLRFPKIDVNWLLTGIESESDSEALANWNEKGFPDSEIWTFFQNKGLSFEACIAEMLIFKAMSDADHILEDIERENLSAFIANKKVGKILESVVDQVLLFKEISAERESNKVDYLKQIVREEKINEINKKLAQEKLKSK